MREIKYRLWDKKNNVMYDWDIAIGFLMDYVRDISKISDDFITMQYTGLKDKNRKEIYEGDIIKEKIAEGEYLYVETIYKDGCFMGKEYRHDPEYPISDFISGEIIGNIYENPELLKEVN